MNQTHCSRCGYNFAAFGKVHRCIPRIGGGVLPAVNPVPLGADSRKPTAAGHRDVRAPEMVAPEAAAPAVDPAVCARGAAGTYKGYRDVEKRRAYMRDYMRQWRVAQRVMEKDRALLAELAKK